MPYHVSIDRRNSLTTERSKCEELSDLGGGKSKKRSLIMTD